MSVYNDLVARIEIRGQLGGQLVMNTFHVSGPVIAGVSSPMVEGGLNTTLDKVQDWVVNEWLPGKSDLFTVDTITARQVVREGGLVIERAINQQGGQLLEVLPNNVALCVSLLSPLSGRSGRGRIFETAIPRTAVVGNNVAPLYADAVGGVWDELRNRLAFFAPLFSHSMVIYSTQLGGAPRPVGLPTPVSQCVVRGLVLDSQRRRLPGRGR